MSLHEDPVGGVNQFKVGETISSDSPKVELGKSKAIVAAITGGVVAAGGVLTTALMDGAIDAGEGIAIFVALLVGLGVPGIGTYTAPTSVTRKR